MPQVSAAARGPRASASALLALAGASLALLHFLLAQHLRVAIRDPELAVLVVALAYFGGVSLGYGLSDRLAPHHLVRLLPLVLVGQLALFLVAQPLAAGIFVAASRAGAGGAAAGWLAAGALGALVSVAGTALHAVFLPRVVALEGCSLRRCYALEVAGSLGGLALLGVLGALSHRLVLAAYLLGFLAIAFLVGARGVRLGLLAALAVGYAAAADRLDRGLAARFYRGWYPDHRIVAVEHTRYSPYHKIEVARQADGGRMLLLDGRRQFVAADHDGYSALVAEYPARLLGAPDVCVLGCGSMSTVGRIGERARSILVVDLDEEVFRTSRAFFAPFNRLGALRNWSFHADDAKHFLGSDGRRFDLIVDDIPPAWSRQVALTYTEQFFRLVRARLTPGGVFSMPSLVGLDAPSPYGRRLIATLARVFERYFVVEYRGAAYFYGGGPGMPPPDEGALRAALGEPDGDAVRVLLQPEVERAVAGEPIITVDNLADLIDAR